MSLDENRAGPRGIPSLGQLAETELSHGLALNTPEDRRRDVRIVGRIVLEAPACFRTIKFFDLIDEDNDKFWWDLSIRADRKLVYQRLLTYGDEGSLRLYLDAALLIDLWPEMNVPEPMRTYWAAVIDATLHAPIPPEHEMGRRDEDTRRTAVDVVRHATS